MLLNAHVDTAPLCDGWAVDPFAGIEKTGGTMGWAPWI